MSMQDSTANNFRSQTVPAGTTFTGTYAALSGTSSGLFFPSSYASAIFTSTDYTMMGFVYASTVRPNPYAHHAIFQT
jgi:hypothetical protein